MIKSLFLLLLIFQFNSVLGQKTLEQVIHETSFSENYYSPFGYFDRAGEKEGVSIQNESKILKRLKLESTKQSEYYIIGKYEINNLILLFISNYSLSEDSHCAILLDKSLNVIDRLDETAYDNAEGFYGVTTNIDYNIIETTTHNIYNDPAYVTKKYTITDKGFKAIKDYVVIKTPSGIRVRNKPTTQSTIVASAHDLEVFNYLSFEYNLDSIFDNGKYLKKYWLEVAKKDSSAHLGYVFGAFAKRHINFFTNDYKVILDEISKEEFNAEESRNESTTPVEKISDVNEIKKVLKDQLLGENNEYGDYMIEKIITDNGKEITSYFDECGILAYYPTYHYLLLECGHASDRLINLKNGEDDVNRIGNPDYYLPSPQNTFRLNGYYSGQSNVHFLEKNIENAAPEYLLSMSSILALDFIEKYFWKDDTTLILKVEKKYYSIQLQKN